MKRILQVTGSLRVGGLENVAMNCMRYSDKSQYHFDYLVYGDDVGEFEKEVEQNGGAVYHVPYPNRGYWRFYKNLKKIIRLHGPYDAVHAHTFFNAGIVMRAAQKEGVPVRIAHAHSVGRIDGKRNIKKAYNIFMRRWLIKYASKYCACSKQAGEYLFTSSLFSKVGILFPNTINVEKYSFSATGRQRIREKYDIKEHQIVIGQVGHLSKEKNQDFLLKVFAEYVKNHDAFLLLVGDGTLQEELKGLAEKLKIDERVIFAGTRNDVPDYLSAMDVFVCTSLHEGFGLVLLEAHANGLRCLIEEKTLVEEVRRLKNCHELRGFNEKKWASEIDKLIVDKRNNNKLLKESEYSDENLKRFLKKIYD